MKQLMIAALMFMAIGVSAQTPAPNDFTTWLQSQQAHAGIGYGLKTTTKYAISWWDLAQYGQSGINIANPSKIHDYVDIGPCISIANGQHPRYGIAMPIHIGNIWNSISLPSKLSSHINLTSIPALVVSPILLAPNDLPLNVWRWDRDFQVALAYSFGGS